MRFSKGEIDRLGSKIRAEKNKISSETLQLLQNYRTSHEHDISQIFNILCGLSKNVRKDSIVTFRIKRIDSIIRKLDRYPNMRFSRMWDIGGCRVILKNNSQVYKLMELIKKELIVKENIKDYIKNPQTDGYKSLHLFVKLPDGDKIIEVQLRNQIDHNWSTLVEITDLLYDSRLKEYGENKELLKFHFLLSKTHEITLKEKKEIARIIKKYSYFERLSEVFSRNYLKVRKQWVEIENLKSKKYFLILASKDSIPKIKSFLNFREAEEEYFNIYKTQQEVNIVLTHLISPNFNQINIAYSNYILSFHSFINDSLKIIESLIIESLKKRKILSFIKFFSLYNNIIFHHIVNLHKELKVATSITIIKFNSSTHGKKRKNKKPKLPKDWSSDLKTKFNNHRNRTNKFVKSLNKSMPKNIIERYMIYRTIKFITQKYNKKLKKVLAKNNDYKQR